MSKSNGVSPFSRTDETRHCFNDSFYILALTGIIKLHGDHKVYERKENRPLKEIESRIRLYRSVENVLNVNGTLCLLCCHGVNTFSTFTNELENLTDYPFPRRNFCACSLAGKIYILGRTIKVSDITNENSDDSCIALDPKASEWGEMAAMREFGVPPSVKLSWAGSWFQEGGCPG